MRAGCSVLVRCQGRVRVQLSIAHGLQFREEDRTRLGRVAVHVVILDRVIVAHHRRSPRTLAGVAVSTDHRSKLVEGGKVGTRHAHLQLTCACAKGRVQLYKGERAAEVVTIVVRGVPCIASAMTPSSPRASNASPRKLPPLAADQLFQLKRPGLDRLLRTQLPSPPCKGGLVGPSKAMITGTIGPYTTESRENALQMSGEELSAWAGEGAVKAAQLKKLTLASDIFHVEATEARIAAANRKANRNAARTVAARERKQERTSAAIDVRVRQGMPQYEKRRWRPSGIPQKSGQTPVSTPR